EGPDRDPTVEDLAAGFALCGARGYYERPSPGLVPGLFVLPQLEQIFLCRVSASKRTSISTPPCGASSARARKPAHWPSSAGARFTKNRPRSASARRRQP